MIEPYPSMSVIETYGKSAEQLGRLLSHGDNTPNVEDLSRKVRAEAERIAGFIIRKAATPT